MGVDVARSSPQVRALENDSRIRISRQKRHRSRRSAMDANA